MKRFALSAAVVAAMTVIPTAVSGADRWATANQEEHRAAFAGATLRLAFGGRSASAPEARLGIGLTSYQRDGTGALISRGGPALPIAASLADGRLQLRIGGQSVPQIERRLGAARSTGTTLLVVGGIAVGALAVVLLTDKDEDNGPCPPGVEVCAF